jgi:hypothetical protein
VGRALRRPLLALALYLPGALLGLLATLPLRGELERYSRSGPWVARLARPDWPAGLVELVGQVAAWQALGEAPAPELMRLGLTALGSLATLALGLLVHGALYTYASGGLLTGLRGEPGSFRQHCGRWFWPQARLGLFGLGLFGLATTLVLALLVVLAPQRFRTLALTLGLLAALLLALNGLLELARASLMASSDRRAHRALGRSLRLLARPRNLLVALLCWLGLALLGAALAALAAVLHVVTLPPLLLALGLQLVAFASAWLKLLRLAVAVDLSARLSAARPLAPPVRPRA